MTTDDRFGTSLSSWLREEAAHRVPDHLAETLVQTAATRQRPWWSSPERLLPMSSTTLGGRVAAPSPILLFAIVGLLTAAIVGIALVASRPAPTIPTGPATNGRIVAVDGTSLVTFAPDGTDRQVLLTLPSSSVPTLAMAPDGTRVAYPVTSPVGVQVARLDDGSVTTITVEGATAVGDEYIGWSPDGRDITFAALVGMKDQLVVAAADGSSVRRLNDSLPTLGTFFWQPTYSPDGQWIAFIGNRIGIAYRELFVVHPDGTGLRALETAAVDAGDGGGPTWSPDRSAHRLAYQTFAGDALHVRMFDLDTDTDYEVGSGFWPSWSPDGTRIAGCCASIWSVDDVVAGTGQAPTTAFFQTPDGGCGELIEWTGQGICSQVTWSPDGEWLVAGDIAGGDLLITRSDGTGEPAVIQATSGVTAGGFRIPLAWQPVWP